MYLLGVQIVQVLAGRAGFVDMSFQWGIYHTKSLVSRHNVLVFL